MSTDTLVRPDSITWKPLATVEKWNDPEQIAWVAARSDVPNADHLKAMHFELLGIQPDEVVESEGNLLTTAGLTRLTALLIASGSPQALTNTSARLGVGNGSTSATVSDTDLAAASGSSNRWFQIMDATYPQVSAGVLTVKSTFAASDGNFAWNEWCIDIGTPTVTSTATVNATMFNRKVASLGTKANPAVWALTATVTIS